MNIRNILFVLLPVAAIAAGCKDFASDFGKSYQIDSIPGPEAKGDYRPYSDELVVTIFTPGKKMKDEKPYITAMQILADGKPAAIKPIFADSIGTDGLEITVSMLAPQVAKQVKVVIETEYVQRIFRSTIQFDRTAETNWVPGIPETKYVRRVEKESK